MSKKPFTTRLDEKVLAIAQRLADAERRSVTSLIEVAVLEYAARRGAPPSPKDETRVDLTAQRADGPGIKVPRKERRSGPNSPAVTARTPRGGSARP